MLYNIQALRALAATMVVFYHINFLFSILRIRAFGIQGVDIFFVISGFIMVDINKRVSETPITFFVNRLIRIAPIYWFLTILLFFLSMLIPEIVQSKNIGINELIKSLMFIPYTRSDGLFRPLIYVGWTLNYEIFFYTLFSFNLFYKSQFNGQVFIFLVFSLLVIYGKFVHPQDPIGRFYTNPIIFEFSLGMILANLIPRIIIKDSYNNRLIIYLLTIISIFILFFCDHNVLSAISTKMGRGFLSMIIVGCAVMLERWGVKTRAMFIIFIGNASYSIYLVHTVVTQAALFVYHRVPLDAVAAVLLIVVTLAAVIGLGSALHVWVEKPMLRWTRSWWANIRLAA